MYVSKICCDVFFVRGVVLYPKKKRVGLAFVCKFGLSFLFAASKRRPVRFRLRCAEARGIAGGQSGRWG